MKLPTADIIARQFCRELHKSIGPGSIAKVNRRNARRKDGSCATHDFCDANVLMDAAFKHITGKDTDDLSQTIPGFNRERDGNMAEAVNAIWTEAWELASRARFDAAKVGVEQQWQVQYHIEVYATTPRSAAEQTLEIIRNPDNHLGLNFYVKKFTNNRRLTPKGFTHVDLDPTC